MTCQCDIDYLDPACTNQEHIDPPSWEKLRAERDELRELYRAAQELNRDIVNSVKREKAEAWDEGFGAGVGAPANRALGLGNPTNPYREAS